MKTRLLTPLFVLSLSAAGAAAADLSVAPSDQLLQLYAKLREHRTLLAHCRKEMIDAEVDKSNHLSATAGKVYKIKIAYEEDSTRDVTLPFRPEKIAIDDTHSILCTTKQ